MLGVCDAEVVCAFGEAGDDGGGIGAFVAGGSFREILGVGLLELDDEGVGFFPGEGDGAVVGDGFLEVGAVGEIDGLSLQGIPAKKKSDGENWESVRE